MTTKTAPGRDRPASWRAALPAALAAVALATAACTGPSKAADRPAAQGTRSTVTTTTAAPPATPSPTTGPATTATTTVPSTTAEPNTTATATTATATTTTAAPPATSAPSTTAPAAEVLRPGDTGAQVLALQQRLRELRYWLGTPNGRYGDLTRQAVVALQKAAGLSRDGVAGPKTRQALDRGVRPSARSTSGHQIEVDKRHQLLLAVTDGKVDWAFNTATGTERPYTYEGHTYLADTPPGHFRVTRQIDGWRTSRLGHLYRPKYFNGGIAVHGFTSVPAYPASHGCVRVSLPAADWLWDGGVAPVGTKVWVY